MLAGNGCDAELWQLSQQLYLGLLPIEAYLALHRDYVAPMVGPVINGALTAADIYALLTFRPSMAAIIQGARLSKEGAERLYSYIKGLFETSQLTAGNVTADEKEISAQLTAEIWKRYKAGTLDQPNPFIDGVATAATGASVSGESVKNIPKEITHNNTSAASASSGPAESLFDRINYLECWNTALRTIQTA